MFLRVREMIVRSPQNSSRGEGRRTSAKKFVAGIAGMVVLFYATVVLACSCIHDDFLGSANAQNITAETADNDTVELCQSVHEQMLPSSVTNPSIRVAQLPYLDLPSHEAVPLRTGTLERFRPPGPTFAHVDISFQFHSILRI
jgi:hypothetical protein